MTDQPCKPGDVVRMRVVMKDGERVFTARVTGLDHKADFRGQEGWFIGYKPSGRRDSVQCGFGYVMLFDRRPHPYGLQAVEVIG